MRSVGGSPEGPRASTEAKLPAQRMVRRSASLHLAAGAIQQQVANLDAEHAPYDRGRHGGTANDFQLDVAPRGRSALLGGGE